MGDIEGQTYVIVQSLFDMDESARRSLYLKLDTCRKFTDVDIVFIAPNV